MSNCRFGHVDSGTVVPELRRAIGAEGRALLDRFNLLNPLVEQMVIREAVAAVEVSDEQLEQARLGLLQQRGYDGLEQWPELLKELERSEDEVLERLRHGIRRRSFMRERFAAKAEARFLERKNELDQVVYGLLRLEKLPGSRALSADRFANELADLAKRYAEGPERNTNGIVGPVSLTQAHRPVENFALPNLGCCWSHSASRTGIAVRLERYSPATFTDEVSDQMCQEMFDAWIEEETASTLTRLASEPIDTFSSTGSSDFSTR